MFLHPAGEVWHISACPAHSNLLTTVYASVRGEGCVGGTGVWRMVGEEDMEQGVLEEVCVLEHEGTARW